MVLISSKVFARLLSRCLLQRTHAFLLFGDATFHSCAIQSKKLCTNEVQKPNFEESSLDDPRKPDNSNSSWRGQDMVSMFPYFPTTNKVGQEKPDEESMKKITTCPNEKTFKPSKPFRDIGSTKSFIIRNTKFSFNISEFKKDRQKMLVITEYHKEAKRTDQIWLSLSAAKTLIEKLEILKFEELQRTGLDEFVDDIKNHKIEFTPKKNHEGILSLKISEVDQNKNISFLPGNKGQAVLVPQDGLLTFKRKLMEILSNFEKPKKPIQPKQLQNLGFNKSLLFGTYQYFLSLAKDVGNNQIFLILSQIDVKQGKKKVELFVSIESTQTLLEVLEDANETIREYEEDLPTEKEPSDVLFEKKFSEKICTYTIQVRVDDRKPSDLKSIRLKIRCRTRNQDLPNVRISIHSKDIPSLLGALESLLFEYERRRIAGLTVEQREQSLKEERTLWEVDHKTELLNLKTLGYQKKI